MSHSYRASNQKEEKKADLLTSQDDLINQIYISVLEKVI
jgi:hypothetical protein